MEKRTEQYSPAEIANTITLLQDLVANPTLISQLTTEQKAALFKAAGQLARPDREEIRKRKKAARKQRRALALEKNKKAREATGIRKARTEAIFKAPAQIALPTGEHESADRILDSPRNCYVCKDEFNKLHFFYDSMCHKCGDLNYKKRFQTASLHGQVALITGARLKIGYQASLLMLRAGATVVATTRFPVDAATRYTREDDFKEWENRLHIHGLDLRHTPSVEIFANYFHQTYGRLDLLINNAAQTVRKPDGFYTHLIKRETGDHLDLSQQEQKLLVNNQHCRQHLHAICKPGQNKEAVLSLAGQDQGPGIGLRESARLSQVPYSQDKGLMAKEVFPKGALDVDLQQVDLRETNSWRLQLGDVSAIEMLEVQLINSVAPFVLCNHLIPLMRQDKTGQKHIVNVTAMEGKFFRFKKDARHPHTNMAKAALNMLTHTSAENLAKEGIFMNAVDTGWVTDEDPERLSKYKQEVHDFQPPLDIVDGAARVCDPFFDGIITGKHWCGKFLKDYFPIDW